MKPEEVLVSVHIPFTRKVHVPPAWLSVAGTPVDNDCNGTQLLGFPTIITKIFLTYLTTMYIKPISLLEANVWRKFSVLLMRLSHN